MNEKISVIVPVYNVEKYLHRCINSILNQSYSNLEIILVDDGSPDNCPLICDEYASKYSSIKVVHKENGGLSSARNAGLEVATGNYIGFVDSDDWIERNMYEYMMNLACVYDADLVDIECQYCHKTGESFNHREEKIDIYEQQDILWHFLHRGITLQNNAPYTVWRKLYKKDIIGNLRFEDGKNGEDIKFNYEVILRAKREIVSSLVMYHYFQNETGICKSKLKRADLYSIEFVEYIYLREKENDYKNINYLANVKLARTYFSILAKIVRDGCGEDICDANNLKKYLEKKLRENYLLLMGSPIASNRKILITLLCIDYRVLEIPFSIKKYINKKRG